MDLQVIQDMVTSISPYVPTAIATLTNAFIGFMFLRKNTGTTEFEKLKADISESYIRKLLDEGVITPAQFLKSKNLLQIAKIAKKYSETHETNAEQQTEAEPKQMNFDWFVRFYEEAGNVSDEMMQDLWAKTLAGEVNKPGSFSLRTLDTLKNMSQEEAEALAWIAPGAMRTGAGIFACKSSWEKNLQSLFDCGIITDRTDLIYISEYDSNKSQILISNFACIFNAKHNDLFRDSLVKFTKVGGELLSLQEEAYDEDCILTDLYMFNKEYPELQLTAHRYEYLGKGSFEYEPEDLFEEVRIAEEIAAEERFIRFIKLLNDKNKSNE
jgi:hypothetical protein